MKQFGIDVSKWQGNFDFDLAKSQGVTFAILRGAYACGKDTKFDQFYAACKLVDLPVGVYQYSMARTVDEALAEAKFLYDNVLRGRQFEFPIYIDIEDATQLALSRDLLTDIAIAWGDYLEKKGFFVGIYAGKYTFRDHMDDNRLKRFSHWIPQWAEMCTYEDKSVLGMWQFGGETNKLRSNVVAGVVCDQNYAYVDFEGIIKANKLNGYGNTPASPKPATKPTAAPQVVYKRGDAVRLKSDAVYYDGKAIPNWVKNSRLYVRSAEMPGGNYNLSVYKVGAITGRVNKKHFTKE